MLEKNYHLLDKQLKSVAKDVNSLVTVDIAHQHELRRGLLNSRFYSCNFFVRWYNRIFSLHRKAVVFTAGMGVVVVSVVTVTVYHQNTTQAHDVANSYIKTVNAEEYPIDYLQDLYKYGFVSYSHYEPDGCRVYKAEKDGQKLMIRDSKPYDIEVVLAN